LELWPTVSSLSAMGAAITAAPAMDAKLNKRVKQRMARIGRGDATYELGLNVRELMRLKNYLPYL
jgi:hypothetical protein